MENLDKEFVKLAKKSRKKRRWLTALISVVVTLVIVVGGGIAYLQISGYYLNQNAQEVQKQANIFNMIAAPNLSVTDYLGSMYSSSSPSKDLNPLDYFVSFNASINKQTYKDLDGYQIPWATQQLHFSPFSYSFEVPYFGYAVHNGGNYNSQNGQKVATFFTPGYTDISGYPSFSASNNSMNYNNGNGGVGIGVTQDAETLSKMPNYLAEVAVTFDKPYTYAEIESMIPSNLAINWYWLGIGTKDIDASTLYTYIGINTGLGAQGQLYAIDDRYWATSDSNFSGTNNNWNQFVQAVKAAPQYLSSPYPYETTSLNGSTFDVYKDAAKLISKETDLDKAKFAGVILTGRTENFAQLTGKSWVYATSVGVTTPVLPYEKPNK